MAPFTRQDLRGWVHEDLQCILLPEEHYSHYTSRDDVIHLVKEDFLRQGKDVPNQLERTLRFLIKKEWTGNYLPNENISIRRKSVRAVTEGHWYVGILYKREAKERYKYITRTGADQPSTSAATTFKRRKRDTSEEIAEPPATKSKATQTAPTLLQITLRPWVRTFAILSVLAANRSKHSQNQHDTPCRRSDTRSSSAARFSGAADSTKPATGSPNLLTS